MGRFRQTARFALTFSVLVSAAQAQGSHPAKPRPFRSVSNLFAGFSGRALAANRVYCGFYNTGNNCTDPSDNGVIEGGFWPNGTPDSYIFNSGIQLAGIVSPTAGFGWAGDTVGAYFMDFRGDQVVGEGLTPIYDSRDTADQRQWPIGAVVRDTALFAPSLLGRSSISDEDYWFRYWDGNPARESGRPHPMGIVVDERVLAFNAPAGNRDMIYLVFTLTNVTAGTATAYTGIDPAVRADFAGLGARFQHLNDSTFGLTIPPGGFTIDSVFLNLAMDVDVGTDHAAQNYSTINLPLGTTIGYEAPFNEPSWSFPADAFGAPGFAPLPGLVGAKFLHFPRDPAGKPVDIRIFTNHTGSAIGYPDPVGVHQLYRYISGTSNTIADNPCSFQGQQLVLKYCYLSQTSADTRFDFSVGPFRLGPGEQQDVVVAYLFAAPRDTVIPYVNGDLKAGFPALGDSIAADPTKIRLIDRVAGWQSQSDANADGIIEGNEVTTFPGSLFNKAQQAQALADAKFLLPSAPTAPSFFLIPGDRQVTVVWQRSATEVSGDPYFSIASDPTSALYDPNYRQFDVEGYRIYRGQSPSALQVVAQFDYSGTQITDYVGDFAYAGQCAPELGIQTACPVTFPATPGPAIHVDHPLVGDIVQVPPGGRLLAPNGAVSLVRTDTAVTGGHSGFPTLQDNGVTFAYIDAGVLNSFPYYYAVTAFDVNSLRSSPSSLESPRAVKVVTPRKLAAGSANTVIVQGVYGDDGVALDSTAPYPKIDSATGTFSGSIPPTNAGAFSLLTTATELLPVGKIVARIDSLSAGLAGGIGTGPTLYFTLTTGRDTIPEAIPVPVPAFNEYVSVTSPYQTLAPLVRDDSNAARRYTALGDTGRRTPVLLTGQATGIAATSAGVAVAAGRYAVASQTAGYLGHSRWFDEGKQEPSDPTIVGDPSNKFNSGMLTGVTTIWAPQAYRGSAAAPVDVAFRGYSYAQTAWYPGDFVVTWNADSSVTVRDVTHHVNLPTAVHGGSGFGFVNVRAFTAAGVTAANLTDPTGTVDITVVGYHHLYAVPATCVRQGIPCVALERKAQLEPLDFNADGTADGNGVVLTVNGEAFFLEMIQLPAAGTKWHLRAVTGDMTATCTPALGPVMTDCTAYTFLGPSVRPAYVPGLQYVIDVRRGFAIDTTSGGDLSHVHTVPDPFYVTNPFALSPDSQEIRFVNLPARAIIRIYSVSGRLVAYFTHNDATGGGEEGWGVRSRDGKTVASGVYFYVVEAPDHRTKVGRFTVVTYRP